jgi:hypothetical protein
LQRFAKRATDPISTLNRPHFDPIRVCGGEFGAQPGGLVGAVRAARSCGEVLVSASLKICSTRVGSSGIVVKQYHRDGRSEKN